MLFPACLYDIDACFLFFGVVHYHVDAQPVEGPDEVFCVLCVSAVDDDFFEVGAEFSDGVESGEGGVVVVGYRFGVGDERRRGFSYADPVGVSAPCGARGENDHVSVVAGERPGRFLVGGGCPTTRSIVVGAAFQAASFVERADGTGVFRGLLFSYFLFFAVVSGHGPGWDGCPVQSNGGDFGCQLCGHGLGKERVTEPVQRSDLTFGSGPGFQ